MKYNVGAQSTRGDKSISLQIVMQAGFSCLKNLFICMTQPCAWSCRQRTVGSGLMFTLRIADSGRYSRR